MEHTINSLVGRRMEASDGDVGRVDDVYFDDESWTVRYLVLKTDGWLSGRKVLIVPVALIQDGGKTGIFRVNLTQDQMRKSPDIDTEKPVSRQQEIELYGHYSWKGYWESGFYAQGVGEIKEVGEAPLGVKGRPAVDLHLRATSYVTGFHIHGTDGEIGHIVDFLLDDQTWKLLYLIVDTHTLPGGKKVLIGIGHILQMQWNDAEIYLDETGTDIEKSPVFEPSAFSVVRSSL
jgi:sporulation protein YlmC with PRC-barrel domain